MKRPSCRWLGLLLVALLIACAVVPAWAAIPCFTPGQDCEAVVVAEIAAARSSVLVQAYEFTSKPIAAALVAAAQRGVDVRVILDKEPAGEGYRLERTDDPAVGTHRRGLVREPAGHRLRLADRHRQDPSGRR
jgi:phosphatidylserine/phosphatidylglycerophosphate/cardiolipin synthase-like enzyme